LQVEGVQTVVKLGKDEYSAIVVGVKADADLAAISRLADVGVHIHFGGSQVNYKLAA